MRQVSPDAIRAVINVTSRTVQGLARNMLVRRLLRDRDYAAAFEEATSIRDAWVRTNAISLIAVEAARAGDGATARDAYNWLDSVRSQGLGADEYFAAAFSAAFARVSLNELGNQERDLDTLNNRMRGILTEADAGSPLNVQVFDLLSLHIDALRVAAGVTMVELQQSASQAGDAADVLFSEVFFAGTAFGFSGEHASPLVRDALEKIAAIDDPQLRLALLVVLGRQMQAREVVVGF